MSNKNLKQSVQAWTELVQDNAFADSVASYSQAIVSSSPIVDRACTWLIAGVAGIAGLAIANIDKMINVYNISEIRYMFLVLGFSLLLGLIQKYFAVSCSTALNAAEQAKSRFAEVIQTFQEQKDQIDEISAAHDLAINPKVDFGIVFQTFIGFFPKWYLWLNRKKLAVAATDRIAANRYLVRYYLWQTLAAFLQLFFIAVFVIQAALYV